MKIRVGFVSNSSTSSFMIYGVHFFRDEYFGEDVWDLADKHGLSVRSTEDDGVYMGADWCCVKDNETGAQFKARVQADVDAALDEGKIDRQACETHEGTYYN